MKHDQLFKRLLQAFFFQLLLLVAPTFAGRLQLAEPSFLDKEHYTDWPDGEPREVDLLARVVEDGSGVPLLVHVEIEARAGAGMGRRLLGYFMQITQRHHLRVLPILVNVRGGRSGVSLGVLEEGFDSLPVPTLVFRYHVLGLAGCRAAEWLARPEPLAWALAALMDRGDWSRAELKLECLRRIGPWEGAGFLKALLINWIESYVQLTGEENAEYRRLLRREDNKEVREMELTWMDKLEAKGEARGLAKGEARGIAKGRAEGVARMREAVLRRIEERFGGVPDRVSAKVAAIRTPEPLIELVEKIRLVESAEDLLPRRRRSRI